MNWADSFLNKTTMYRLMLYYLIALVLIAIILGAAEVLPYDPLAIALSAFFLCAICYGANWIFARLFKVVANPESQFITALILTLVIQPKLSWQIVVAGVAAMGAKYIFAFEKRHVFNPAAAGIFLSAILFRQEASWWVGNQYMVIIVLIGGLILMRKIRRFHTALSFLGTVIFLAVLLMSVSGADEINILNQVGGYLVFSPILFFSFVMLVEPLTSPTRRDLRIFYGIAIGILFVLLQRISASAPYALEASLLVGNIFSRVVQKNPRFVFTLINKKKIAPDIKEFWFEPDRKLNFSAGQYLEWTLAHKNPDDRGMRRYFTISASPTERLALITTRIFPEPSTFKAALDNMQIGDRIVAGNLEGDFILPKDLKTKMVFMAGGIGITPFRSMIKYMLDMNLKGDIILLYSNKTEASIIFKDIFEEANRRFGLKIVFVITENNEAEPTLEKIPLMSPLQDEKSRMGHIDENMIREEVPDYDERIFYISGPEPMAQSFEKTLLKMGVRDNQIKRDFFPGYPGQ